MIGREFTDELLEAVCEERRHRRCHRGRARRPDHRALAARSGGWLFAHAVFRETLYEELDPQRRRELHLRAGRALEEQCRDDPDRFLPALARHFLEAGPGHEQQALAFSLAAGRQAASRLAHSDAADHLERALSVLPPGDAATELELQLELADEMIRSGRFIDARAMIAAAAAIAREARRHAAGWPRQRSRSARSPRRAPRIRRSPSCSRRRSRRSATSDPGLRSRLLVGLDAGVLLGGRGRLRQAAQRRGGRDRPRARRRRRRSPSRW